MIEVEKIYTDNPFTDNLIYYAKFLALNCTIKNEEKALANESAESARNGNILIASINGTSRYETYDKFPIELLQKYINQKTNLDIYVEDLDALHAHLNSLPMAKRINAYQDLSDLARDVYINHYDIMVNYLDGLSETWIDDYRPLYDSCVAGSATYEDLFYELPEYTRNRIIKRYINNYNNADWNTILSTLDVFRDYITSRAYDSITLEVEYINKAMHNVFKSHYEMMIQRSYVSKDYNHWREYKSYKAIFAKCNDGSATYQELYDLFPKNDLKTALENSLSEPADVEAYSLTEGLDILEDYFEQVSVSPETEIALLEANMMEMYLSNYNIMMSTEIYDRCIDLTIEYDELSQYMPKETLKMLLNVFIDEVSNLETYAENKDALNYYLSTIDSNTADGIKASLAADMREWYPINHVETNNYYRTLIGLAPMDSKGNVYEDTLEHTYDDKSRSFINFGTEFLERLEDTIYPESHWIQPICNFDAYDIAILNEYGVLDDYIEACHKENVNADADRYTYFKYLGDNKLDLYTCRRARRFDLIGLPMVSDTDARDKFVDHYGLCRDYVARVVYSDAYKFQSDYYDQFIIIFILLNTIMDMCSDVPQYIIDRKIFDSRCIKYLFESFGIPYYSEIPVKYQKAMVKNLNTLIKYKSSTRNMIDICSLFGFDDVKVFNYYMFKSRNKDISTGQYLFDEKNSIDYDADLLYIMNQNGDVLDYNGVRYYKLTDIMEDETDPKYFTRISVTNADDEVEDKYIIRNDIDWYVKDPDDEENFIPFKDLDYFTKIQSSTKACELKFIKVPIGEAITEYKNDEDYISTYEEVVSGDPTWTGDENSDSVKNKILDYEFNAVRTKYISIETVTEMTELAFQVSYFYNLLFDNFYAEDNLTVEIPFIKQGHKFRFMDVICYLFALTYIYSGLEDNIMYSPSQILYVKGYNFNDALNEVLNDPKHFKQTDDAGNDLKQYQKYNIFDINTRIDQDNYKYQDAFKDYGIKAFNLGADVDELERWLQSNYHMSLEDFVVDDTMINFDHIITLRSFFSLNNSYYQKIVFNGDNLLPLPYNQTIKYAYGYNLYRRNNVYDLNNNAHSLININDEIYEIINVSDLIVYLMDASKYVTLAGSEYTIYYPFFHDADNNYIEYSGHPYFRTNSSTTYNRLFNKSKHIRNSDKLYVFSEDHYYKRISNNTYEEIVDPKYYIEDPYNENEQILLFGEYYIKNNSGNWILNPENCYVRVERDGEVDYMLLTDTEEIYDPIVAEENCYILKPDGSFVSLIDTDYFDPEAGLDSHIFNEVECFVKSDVPTEWFDPRFPDVFYRKMSEYYSENAYIIFANPYYIKNDDGTFTPESELINPNNCYYYNTSTNDYVLVGDVIAKYSEYTDINRNHLLILQNDNNYNRYSLRNNAYELDELENTLFVFNSDKRFILTFDTTASYSNGSEMIISFNTALGTEESASETAIVADVYNPEIDDDVWDENDWFYEDPENGIANPNNPIGINGENTWYYKDPNGGGQEDDPEDDNINTITLGSGFYIEADAYLGSTELIEGERYYMYFDIETNWNGRMQISNEADVSCTTTMDRNYTITKDIDIHISQVFTANANKRPSIKFVIYDYKTFPIEVGDYIIVKNIGFMKSYNENFIPQDIPSYDKLQELYRTNEAIYKYICKLMNETSDKRLYDVYKHIYDSLMVSKYNKEAFKLDDTHYAKTYTDFLEARDATLYDKLVYFKSLDIDSMHKQVADNIVEVSYALDDCVDTYSYGYLYSYFPAVSASYIQQYISKIINFFKSWKVHLTGINTVYKLDDSLDNTVKVLESQFYRDVIHKTDTTYVYDAVKINPVDGVNPQGIPYSTLFGDEWTNVTHRVSDRVGPRDSVRIVATYGNKIDYIKDKTEMLIKFNSNDHEAMNENNELVIKSSSAGFSVANENELIMSTDYEDEQTNFIAQHIGDINNDTSDVHDLYDWRNKENE